MLAPRLDELDFPTADGLAAWTRLWRDFPGAWAALLRRFSASVLAAPNRYLDWVAAYRCVLVAGEASDSEDEFLCHLCGRWFLSEAGLRMHCTRVHEQRCEVHHFVRDAGCPVCNRWYHTRVRAIYHVRHAPSCLEAVRAGLVPRLPVELVTELDQADLLLRRAGGSFAAARQTRAPVCVCVKRKKPVFGI